jgi:hypothetical protein
MSRFNWWRRERKKKKLSPDQTLKGKSKLLQQIEHGDFDLSDYKRQADNEFVLRDAERQKIRSKWVASQDSLEHKLREVDFSYQKRYNRLYKDFDLDEKRLLEELQYRLLKEFKVDVWEQALNYPNELTLEQFYHVYKQLANEQISKKPRPKVSSNRKLPKVSS